MTATVVRSKLVLRSAMEPFSAALCDDAFIWDRTDLPVLSGLSRLRADDASLTDELREMCLRSKKEVEVQNSAEERRKTLVWGALSLKYLREDDMTQKFKLCAPDFLVAVEIAWLNKENDVEADVVRLAWTKYINVASSYVTNYHQLLDADQLRKRHNRLTLNAEALGDVHVTVSSLVASACRGTRLESYSENQVGIIYFGIGVNGSQKFTKLKSLRKALECHERAISSYQAEDVQSIGVYYAWAAWTHSQAFDISTNLSHCSLAISNFESAIPLLQSSTPPWNGCVDRVARLYWKRWTEESKSEDADAGVKWFEVLLHHVPNHPHALSGLAQLLELRAERQILSNSERRAVSDRALQLLKTVIDATSNADSALPSRLGKYSSVLADRFKYDGLREDIDNAIAYQERAIALPQTLSSGLWFHYAQLSSYWQQRFFQTRKSSDLASAREAALKSHQNAGKSAECQERALLELACTRASSYQFGITQDLAELDKAIEDFRLAMKIRPDWRSVHALRNLGGALMLRFDRAGSAEDVSEGIAYIREAVDILRRLAGKGNHQEEIQALQLLAKAHEQRAQRYRGQEDLDEAVRLRWQVYNLIDEEHARRTDRVCDLAFALSERYYFSERRNISDIRDAQRVIEEQVSLNGGRMNLTERLELNRLLGMVSLRLYTIDESLSTIDEAIRLLRLCADTVPPADDDAAKATIDLSAETLAQALHSKATNTSSDKDYLAAMQQYSSLINGYQSAGTQTPSHLLKSLGDVAWAFSKNKGHPRAGASRTAAILARTAFCELLGRVDISVESKLETAVAVSQLYYLIDENVFEAQVYAIAAVQSLAEATTLGLSRFDHLALIKRQSTLPSQSLCFSIMNEGDVAGALQEYEKTRTVIWNRLLSDKTPLKALQDQDEDLYRKFTALRLQLSETRKPASSLDTDRMAYDAPDYFRLTQDYTKTLNQIHAMPGLENFLQLPEDVEELKNFAVDGPIVVANLTPWYSHAIIIQKHDVFNIEVPMRDRNASDFYKNIKDAVAMLQRDIDTATRIFKEVMKFMWEDLARPILDALKFHGQRDEHGQLPRLWWVASGWLTVLPVHAAGDYLTEGPTDSPQCVAERVVSSYVPNLQALARLRQVEADREKQMSEPQEAVLISMPETPGHERLPNATVEAEAVSALLPSASMTAQILTQPTRATVLSALENATLLHVIGHGVASPEDPTRSLLLLADHARAPLDVRTLHRARIARCRLAFLAACETAVTLDSGLKDEGLHVAGAFMMADVANVVASSWRVVDEESVGLAEAFYRELFGHGRSAEVPWKGGPARALHHAAEAIRAKGRSPFVWAAYVHFGI